MGISGSFFYCYVGVHYLTIPQFLYLFFLLIIIYSQLLTLTNKSAVNNLVHIFVLSIFFDGQITPLGDKTVSDIGDL